MIIVTITGAEIEQFRQQLATTHLEALAAFDAIQECEGHLVDAAKLIALRANLEGDPVMSREDWFYSTLKKYKASEGLRNSMKHSFLDTMAFLIDFLTKYLCCTSTTAKNIAVPFGIYIVKEMPIIDHI